MYDYFAELYSSRANYCMVFLSSYYVAKSWTNHERISAQAKAFEGKTEYILPVKLDDTEIPSIPRTIGYLDINESSPEEIAALTIQKLGR